MLDGLLFRFRLWKLQQEKRRIQRMYKNHIQKARRQKKNGDQIDRLIGEQRLETDLVDDDIMQLVTQHLLQESDKFLLPRLDLKNKELWTESRITGYHQLSPTAITQLRSAIRKERKESSEHIQIWLVGLTGLVGALTGLVALLSRN